MKNFPLKNPRSPEQTQQAVVQLESGVIHIHFFPETKKARGELLPAGNRLGFSSFAVVLALDLEDAKAQLTGIFSSKK